MKFSKMNDVKWTCLVLGFLIVILSVASCKKKGNDPAQLSVSPTTVSFPAEGGTIDLSVSSNGQWSISNPLSSWLQSSSTSGNSGSTAIHLTTLSQNGTGATRSGYLTINSSNGQSRRVAVSQLPTIYP